MFGKFWTQSKFLRSNLFFWLLFSNPSCIILPIPPGCGSVWPSRPALPVADAAGRAGCAAATSLHAAGGRYSAGAVCAVVDSRRRCLHRGEYRVPQTGDSWRSRFIGKEDIGHRKPEERLLYALIIFKSIFTRMWLSLVERLLWEQDAAGSNPVIRTKNQEIAFAISWFLFCDRELRQLASKARRLLWAKSLSAAGGRWRTRILVQRSIADAADLSARKISGTANRRRSRRCREFESRHLDQKRQLKAVSFLSVESRQSGYPPVLLIYFGGIGASFYISRHFHQPAIITIHLTLFRWRIGVFTDENPWFPKNIANSYFSCYYSYDMILILITFFGRKGPNDD